MICQLLLSFLVFSCHILVSNAIDQCTSAKDILDDKPAEGLSTDGANQDFVNGGACHGQPIGETPGIWWKFQATAKGMYRASTCDSKTQIKVKMTIFKSSDGTCDTLTCDQVSTEPDFECPLSTFGETTSDSWSSISSKIDFETEAGVWYYFLVQQISSNEIGTVAMTIRKVTLPQNNDCKHAIGPVPRDGTIIPTSNEDASVSYPLAGYCNYQNGPYPGIWFQMFGNGGDLVLSACAKDNDVGFFFSVYEAANCHELSCASTGTGITEKIDGDPKCNFLVSQVGPEAEFKQSPRFTWTLKGSKDGNRYYVYLHFQTADIDKVTTSEAGDLRFFVENGDDVQPSDSFGVGAIDYKESAYGFGAYNPGLNNRKNFTDAGLVNKGEGGGGSSDASSQGLHLVATLSSLLLFIAVLV